jgi:hypothetical protein
MATYDTLTKDELLAKAAAYNEANQVCFILVTCGLRSDSDSSFST